MFDAWTWQAKLIGLTVAAAAIAALAFVAVQVTGSSAPAAPSASAVATLPAMPTAPKTYVAPTTPAPPTTFVAPAEPSALTMLTRLHYSLIGKSGKSGSTTMWAPPTNADPKVTLTSAVAIAYFPAGFSCYIPLGGEVVAKGTFFGVGQLINFGGTIVKRSELSRSVTRRVRVTSRGIPVGYLHCRLT